jgi:hypothetical protein
MEMFTGILGAVPFDWFVLGGILVAVALDSLRSGLGRAVAISVALPLAAFVFTLTKDAFILSSTGGMFSSPMVQLGLFAVLAVALYFLLRRMGLEYVDGGHGGPVQALLAGAATAIVFACVWLQMPVLSDWWSFGSQVQAIFAPAFRLWAILVAYGALAFARG